ncbi:VOC family protein [Aquabacter sp. L1I39]|uniref:bleomycin resistance protein n=1 Tax=Aquabacter sp. L1I39 TaxID=2820278 RepID=UPI001AD97301|nr:VOC family protein [Aquabacter sp. L1I39]QTL03642.1 VOC family protein [Aquabacter sp. L1I39]
MSRLLRGCPVLASADIPAAVDWYRERLGFEVRRTGPDYGIVEKDGVELHFWPCQDRSIAENTSAYLRVDDVDRLHASFEGAREGGRISEVADRAWGMREFYVWDPDGNLLRCGAPVAGSGPV